MGVVPGFLHGTLLITVASGSPPHSSNRTSTTSHMKHYIQTLAALFPACMYIYIVNSYRQYVGVPYRQLQINCVDLDLLFNSLFISFLYCIVSTSAL